VQTVARQLVRAIRGKRSQEAFSRRLDYTSNPVADWEAGRRFPTAAETLRACRVAGIDVRAAIARFTPAEAAEIGDADDDAIAAWLRALRGNTALKDLAARTGESRYAVSRWLEGRTRPRLPEFLGLLDALTDRLSDFVAELVPIEEVPVLQHRHEQRRASRRLAFDEPWVAAILVLIETTAYQELPRHVPGWLAGRLDIEEEIEARCLRRLVEAGVAVQEGTRPYRIRDALTIDARAEPDGMKRLKAHWASLGFRRATAPHDGDLVSYNVIAVSRADLERIREAHVRYFLEVRSIVANSRPEVAGLVNVQLLTWDQPGPDPSGPPR
jgi:transcriptional regulator with XRE-family HTH domain